MAGYQTLVVVFHKEYRGHGSNFAWPQLESMFCHIIFTKSKVEYYGRLSNFSCCYSQRMQRTWIKFCMTLARKYVLSYYIYYVKKWSIMAGYQTLGVVIH